MSEDRHLSPCPAGQVRSPLGRGRSVGAGAGGRERLSGEVGQRPPFPPRRGVLTAEQWIWRRPSPGRALSFGRVERLGLQSAVAERQQEVVGYVLPGWRLERVAQAAESARHGLDVQGDPAQDRHGEHALGMS